MRFATNRLKYLYFAIKLAVIALIGAAMSYAAHFVFLRMLGGEADIAVLSICVGAVCGALLIAAAAFALLWAVAYKKDKPKPSIAEAEALLCVKTNVPLASGKEIEEIAKEGDAGGVLCLQSTLLIATAVQFLALIVKVRLTATTWVALALAVLLAITVFAGQFKRAKQDPLDADALVRKLATYRELHPKPKRGDASRDERSDDDQNEFGVGPEGDGGKEENDDENGV